MTEWIDPGLRAYIEENILPLYEGFDPAHGPGHARQVMADSLALLPAARELAGVVDANIVYTVAAYHDIGLQAGREGHGTASKELLLADRELDRWFTNEQIALMGDAVEDHRASRKEAPRSIYGRIVSEADRELDPERVVKRCMEYGRAHCPELNDEEQIDRAVAHMERKHGENGYLRLWLPCEKNQRGLCTLRAWLKSGEIREICRRYL